MTSDSRLYSVREEVANCITHGAGVVLSVVGLTLMVVFASFSGDPWRIVSVSIFGASLVVLYAASTLYHAFSQPKIKNALRVFDHSAIYLLIAGTYTPFLLVNMRGPWGWSMLSVLWVMAAIGCVFKIFFVGKWNKLATLCYVIMGWMIVVAIKPTIESNPSIALLLMLIGGLFYTGGVIFYLWDRLPYNHAIWHVFVLGGSISHFFAIFFFIAISRASV